MKKWYVYIIECEKDGTLYTGCSTDVNRRLLEHNSGRGAKYTRSRIPVKIRAVFEFENHSKALKEEYRIKQLTRQEKLNLCEKESI